MSKLCVGRLLFGAAAMTAILFAGQSFADQRPKNGATGITVHGKHGTVQADGHAPIGVMGDHTHNAGEWMLSYRYMRMFMDGNRDGTDNLDEATIATTVANRFLVSRGNPPRFVSSPPT